MFALFKISLTLVYIVTLLYGAYEGFQVGKNMKEYSVEEIHGFATLIQVFSILFSWIGWITALICINRFALDEDERKIKLIICIAIVFMYHAIRAIW